MTVAPAFCACCLEERGDLTPTKERSANGTLRTVWRCSGCFEAGPYSDLAQHDIADGKDPFIFGSCDGGKRRPTGK